jgi:PAS domain S-box-containing protein
VEALVQQTLLGDAWEHATVAAAVFADDARYIACNQAFIRLTGYSREEILAMQVGVDLAPDPVTNRRLFDGIVTEGRTHGSGGLRRKGGTVISVNFWAIEARAANLPYFITLYWKAETPPSFA